MLRLQVEPDTREEQMPRIVVVGGGISGLAAAFRIRQALPHAEVGLLERGPTAGGNIGTEYQTGFTVERGPNGLFDAKPHAVQLCRDLGLGAELIRGSEAARKNRYLFINGRLQSFPTGPLGILKTPLLSSRGRLRLLAEPLQRRRGASQVEESVAEFARRRFGLEAAAVFIDALVTGIHAGDPEHLSAAAAFPRMVQFEREHGSVIRGMIAAAKARRRAMQARGEAPAPQSMWSFRHGLQVMIDALAKQLGPALRTNAPVVKLTQHNATWVLTTANDEQVTADAVVLTTPAWHQAELLADTSLSLAQEMRSIQYNAIAVVALGYRIKDTPQQPDGFGYIAPQNTGRPVLGVQWCSSVFPDRAPPGHRLWRALCGGMSRPDVAAMPDDILLQTVREELRETMGVTATPTFHRIVRWPRAIPQYTVSHLARVHRIMAKCAEYPGLYLGGNAYHGVAINDCIEQADVLANCLRNINFSHHDRELNL
jgi:oxygen-dependent protoporphyrinogen oxidase